MAVGEDRNKTLLELGLGQFRGEVELDLGGSELNILVFEEDVFHVLLGFGPVEVEWHKVGVYER